MIRVLFMIAIAGFVLSVATLSAAVAIGGPDAIARGGWVLAGKHWDSDWTWDWDDDHGGHAASWSGETGPQTTRTLAWSGADSLDLDLAADVRYIQSPGPASVVVTGPQRIVERVIVRGDSIGYAHGAHHPGYPKLTIVVRAPGISRFDISGRNTLAIEGYHQPQLRLDVSGDAEVTAAGEADEINLDLSGSGEADLAALKAKGAQVDISGAADAVIAPTEWAKLDISGMGDVQLLTNPPRLETDVSGAGKVRQGEPPPGPSPSPSQAPRGSKL